MSARSRFPAKRGLESKSGPQRVGNPGEKSPPCAGSAVVPGQSRPKPDLRRIPKLLWIVYLAAARIAAATVLSSFSLVKGLLR